MIFTFAACAALAIAAALLARRFAPGVGRLHAGRVFTLCVVATIGLFALGPLYQGLLPDWSIALALFIGTFGFANLVLALIVEPGRRIA